MDPQKHDWDIKPFVNSRYWVVAGVWKELRQEAEQEVGG